MQKRSNKRRQPDDELPATEGAVELQLQDDNVDIQNDASAGEDNEDVANNDPDSGKVRWRSSAKRKSYEDALKHWRSDRYAGPECEDWSGDEEWVLSSKILNLIARDPRITSVNSFAPLQPGENITLFLDVKGAFPHAHPKRLAENMRLLGVPKVYIDWMLVKLDGRTTCLSFDDFVSIALPILNGIDQGCPPSVIFYLLYNSPLVLVANPDPKRRELCIAYIDDITFVVWAKSFDETLANMMKRRKGALAWSASHNSTFELDKTACVDFPLSNATPRPTLTIDSQDITHVFSHTLLGVIIDKELRWKDQCNKALTRGMQWVTQLSRLGNMSYGASASVLRRLYHSVAVPRFTYAADSGTPRFRPEISSHSEHSSQDHPWSNAIYPVHSLDAHASLLPMHLLQNETYQRAAIHLTSAPSNHPLFKAVLHCAKGRKSHITSIQRILQFMDCQPRGIEKWSLARKSRAGFSPITFPKRSAALMESMPTVQGHRKGVGAAAVSFEHRELQKTTGFKLGGQNGFSVLDAELAAIILAAHLILETTVVDDAVVFTDSQTAIRALKGDHTVATQSILKAAKRMLSHARRKAGGTE
ncbi:hypothetical protein FRC10_001267, partial [Ceratobasidium sp. 414]